MHISITFYRVKSCGDLLWHSQKQLKSKVRIIVVADVVDLLLFYVHGKQLRHVETVSYVILN